MDALIKYVMWNFKVSIKEYCTDDAGRTSQQKFTILLSNILNEKKKKHEQDMIADAVAKAKAAPRGGILGMFV